MSRKNEQNMHSDSQHNPHDFIQTKLNSNKTSISLKFCKKKEDRVDDTCKVFSILLFCIRDYYGNKRIKMTTEKDKSIEK